jgi:transcriptional regulator with XRE-family HTH domain
MNVAKELKSYRKKHKLTQQDLAGLLGFETRAMVCRLERGNRTATPTLIKLLEKILWNGTKGK